MADARAAMTEPGNFADTDTVLIYVTCGSRDEACRIGRSLIAHGLAACVNIGGHDAIYRWQGELRQAAEASLLAKTTGRAYARARDHVLALHSDTLPGLTAWRVTGHAPFLAWVSDACAPAGGATGGALSAP